MVTRTFRMQLSSSLGDDAILRLLRALLKTLGRYYGVRCREVVMESATDAAPLDAR